MSYPTPSSSEIDAKRPRRFRCFPSSLPIYGEPQTPRSAQPTNGNLSTFKNARVSIEKFQPFFTPVLRDNS